jgi:hypothetical protein
MPQPPDDLMDLEELEALLADSPKPLRDLFVKAINLYADPLKNTADDDQKRHQLQLAIEAVASPKKG